MRIEFCPVYRHNSSDYGIWEEVFIRNEYCLSTFEPTDVVIDVGAHIGAFACACLARKAQHIVAFEPDLHSFSLAQQNVIAFQKYISASAMINLNNAAVWRSDLTDSVYITQVGPSDHAAHFAAQSTLFKNETTYLVSSMSLDAILAPYRDVTLLKLDCEGAEWPILFTAHHIYKVRQLCLELHSLAWKAHELKRTLPEKVVAEFGRYSLFDLTKHLYGFGLLLKQEQINWNVNGNRDYYYGKLWFENAAAGAS